jgi:cytochrome c biogenesis protein CcmG, thiol:disulfide interchange protein DsbE
MRGMSRIASAVIAVALLSAPAEAAKLHVGDPVPHFSVRTFDKQVVDSDNLRGQVVIVNRWAIWCGPCKQELPELDAYYRKHAKEGLRIFAVTVDQTVSDSALDHGLSRFLAFPLAHAVKGPFPEKEGVPTNYVIDRKGIVRFIQAGAFDAQSLDAVIGPLLAEAPPVQTAAVAH